jgi:hypothetical protein
MLTGWKERLSKGKWSVESGGEIGITSENYNQEFKIKYLDLI